MTVDRYLNDSESEPNSQDGTTTLVQVDICDSTSIGEALGDANVSALWVEHDRRSRGLIQTYRGCEIEKTDGFMLLFDDAADATRFVGEYHLMLARLSTPLRARAAMYVGTVVRRVNSAIDIAAGAKPLDIDGRAKPIVARLMSIASPGQTLMTVEGGQPVPSSIRTLPHGHWWLKGVADPVEIFELAESVGKIELPRESEKAYRVVRRDGIWLPLREIPNSLPQEVDPWVGRQRELRELRQIFEVESRLVTVTGIGGSGKTRLAKRCGWVWLGDFPGGVWFCDLSHAKSLDGVLHAAAEGLGLLLGKGDPVAQLGYAITSRGKCLVILDNFEHLRDLARDAVSRWMGQARDARFLVTSQQRLHIPGERVFRLNALARDEARQLFLDRAAAVADELPLGSEDLEIVDQIVSMVDCLPLAIELAASRVQIMGVRTLLKRMDDRLRVLSSKQGNVGRQSTLRATFDWSWELLSEPEKASLAQLSTFEGGISLAAAEAVIEIPVGAGEVWLIDVMQSLVEKSLLKHVASERYELLGILKEYASERLRGAADGGRLGLRDATERRHFAYFASVGGAGATRDKCVELGNIVVACRRALRFGDGDAAIRCLVAASAAIQWRGPFRAAAELAVEVGASDVLNKSERAEASYVAGTAFRSTGNYASARQFLDDALASAESTSLLARIHSGLGYLRVREGRLDEALLAFEAASCLQTQGQDSQMDCEILCGLGVTHEQAGRLDDARRYYNQLFATAESAGDRRWQGGALGNLALIDAIEGRQPEARHRLETALDLARQVGDVQFEGNTLCNLGQLLQEMGHLEDASHSLAEALSVAGNMGYARLQAVSLCNLALVEEAMGRAQPALEHLEQALTAAQKLHDRRLEGQFCVYLGALQSRMKHFSLARAYLDTGERLLVEVDDALSLALLLCARAECESIAGNAELAEAYLAKAIAKSPINQAGDSSEFMRWVTRLRAAGPRRPDIER